MCETRISRTVLDDWWPVTYDYGLVRSDLERVADARRQTYADAGMEVSSTVLNAALGDVLSVLEPLSPAPTKELYVATTFGWTAYFANGCRGSDPSLPMKQLAKKLGVMTLRACTTPETFQYPGVILEVYDTAQAGANRYGYRRSIAALNDGGRWVFEQSGTPFPSEDISRYDAQRKRDRFTPDMLADLLCALGAQPLSDRALQKGETCSGFLLERPAHDHLPAYTLEQAKIRQDRRSTQ